MGPYFRGFLLTCLIVCAIRAGWWISNTLFDLLSFQLIIYKQFLTVQTEISGTYNQVQNSFNQAAEYLGRDRGYMASGKSELIIDERINEFAQKLRMIGHICGGLVSLLVFKIGFDIVFGIKKLRQRIVSFIKE